MKTSERLRLRRPVMPEAERITVGRGFTRRKTFIVAAATNGSCARSGLAHAIRPGSSRYHCTECDLF